MPSAYVSSVLADAPKHYWRGNELGGSIFFDAGSFPLHLMAGSLTLPTGYHGPVSDGGSGWIDAIDACPRFLDGAFTDRPISLEIWYWQHYTRAAAQMLLEHSDAAGPGFAIGITAGGLPQFFCNTLTLIAGGPFTQQHWHHVVATYDLTTARIYVDGSLAGSGAVASPASASKPITIGFQSNGSQVASVNWSEAALYDHVLSAARVLAHTNAADQVNTLPYFIAYGSAPAVPSGPFTPDSTNSAAILASVRKTYPTT